MRKRKLVYGVGVNDAGYNVNPKVNGKHVTCIFYRIWSHMLERCYSVKCKTKNPTYKGCTVCEEWLTFSNFKKWMDSQNFEDKQLDKDILISGNKVYSPDTCVFVSATVNTLLNNNASARGKYKQGVSWDKRRNKFQSRVRLYGKKKSLGHHDTEQEAYAAYVAAKSAHIREIAGNQEPRVKAGLYRHAAELENTLKTEN